MPRADARRDEVEGARACSLGVCRVTLGPQGISRVSLEDGFPEGLPAPSAARAEELDLAGVLDAVVARIEWPRRAAAPLPLDLRGTAFQRQVWQALLAIPVGETRSYAALAGSTSGARAVAQACAANRLAVLVPCHRVLRSDGGLAGYRWGVARKLALLQREGAGGLL